MNASLRPAVFLDRDGVLNRERGFVRSADELEVLDGVPEALERLAELGMARVVVTNQSGVARGLFSESDLAAIHDKLRAHCNVDAIYYCPHHPEEGQARYRCDCDCRKPRPGMLLQAAQELGIDLDASWLVGDAPRDLEAGALAGCRTIGVLGVKLPSTDSLTHAAQPPEHAVHSLPEAVDWIERALSKAS